VVWVFGVVIPVLREAKEKREIARDREKLALESEKEWAAQKARDDAWWREREKLD
jgi:hypothetical protein